MLKLCLRYLKWYIIRLSELKLLFKSIYTLSLATLRAYDIPSLRACSSLLNLAITYSLLSSVLTSSPASVLHLQAVQHAYDCNCNNISSFHGQCAYTHIPLNCILRINGLSALITADTSFNWEYSPFLLHRFSYLPAGSLPAWNYLSYCLAHLNQLLLFPNHYPVQVQILPS